MDTINNQQAREPDEVDAPRTQVLLMRGIGGGRKTEDVLGKFGELQRQQLADGVKPRQDVIFTPRHNLNDEVAERWERDTGLTAATIMGRTAKDPRHVKPEKADPNWCKYPELVDATTDVGKSVQGTCCIQKNEDGTTTECDALTWCGFQKQPERARNSNLVTMPHQLLTHEQKELERPGNVGIDEDFIESQIDKLPREKSDFRFEVDELRGADELSALPGNKYQMLVYNEDRASLLDLQLLLHDRLKAQIDAGELGGIQKKHLTLRDRRGFSITAGRLGQLKYLAWKLMPEITELRPNMGGREIEHCRQRHAKKWAQRRGLMFVARLAEVLHEAMERDDIEVSGRAYLYRDVKSQRVCIGLRWLRPIVQQWRTNNIVVMSATMPAVEIVSHAFPGCDVIPDDTDYDVEMPEFTRFVQVKNAPVSQTKVATPANQVALRRYAMERVLELNIAEPDSTDDKALPVILIGVQKDLEEAWQATPLPGHYSVRHFGDVSGLNQFREVRLLVSMGTTLVKPLDIEDQIAAITGRDPQRLREGWFLRARGAIVLKDGSRVGVQCHMHPDELAEKCALLACRLRATPAAHLSLCPGS